MIYLERLVSLASLIYVCVCVCMKKVKMLVAQLCPTLCNPMDCSPPGFSVHGIFYAQEYWSE